MATDKEILKMAKQELESAERMLEYQREDIKRWESKANFYSHIVKLLEKK